MKRSKMPDAGRNNLGDETLLIGLEIRVRPEDKYFDAEPNSHTEKLLELLETGEGADVAFKVGAEVISAHKDVLRMISPSLLNFCEENDDGSPIPIDAIAPGIFRIVLRYIYAEEIPDAVTIQENAKDIINAANRFGVVAFKLAVESFLIESLTINSTDAADWLVFADTKACPLLKEYAMSYCVVRAAELLGSETWKILNEYPVLIGELVEEIATRGL